MPDLSTKAESTLSPKTDVNKTDSVRLVGTDDHSYKSSVGDLAKCVLEECNVSSLAGATQTPKSAIDTLNSNKYHLDVSSCTQIPSNSDLNNYKDCGVYIIINSTAAQTMSNMPPRQTGGKLIVEDILKRTAGSESSYRCMQTFMPNGYAGEFYRRQWTGSAWSAWNKFTETDTLNSNMIAIPVTAYYSASAQKDCDTLTEKLALCSAGAGLHYPENSNNWYVHSFAFNKKSDGTINNGYQIAVRYAQDARIEYYRRCGSGTWSSWEQLPSRAEVDTLNRKIAYKTITLSANETQTLWDKGIISTTGYYRLTAFTRKALSNVASDYFFLTGGSTSAILSKVCEGTDDYAPILTSGCVLKLKAAATSEQVFYRIERLG